MKGRMRNFANGDAGQERIQKKLESLGFDIETESGNKHYDLILKIENLTFAVECKSIRPYSLKNGTNRFGSVKLRRSQIYGLRLLWTQDIKPIIISELRPRTSSNIAYMMVPWKPIWKKFLKSTPHYLTLPFWWILRNGVNLDWWLKQITSIHDHRVIFDEINQRSDANGNGN